MSVKNNGFAQKSKGNPLRFEALGLAFDPVLNLHLGTGCDLDENMWSQHV